MCVCVCVCVLRGDAQRTFGLDIAGASAFRIVAPYLQWEHMCNRETDREADREANTEGHREADREADREAVSIGQSRHFSKASI